MLPTKYDTIPYNQCSAARPLEKTDLSHSAPAAMAKPRVIYWFRTDLRLHDSPALKAALDLDPECLYPIWTWDPHYVYRARVGMNRFNFLYANGPFDVIAERSSV